MADASLIEAAGAVFRKGFGAILAIEPEGGPAFFVDGRSATCTILTDAPGEKPDCRWGANAETLARIFEGGRALESAYLSGRLKIAGDMSVMARLDLENMR